MSCQQTKNWSRLNQNSDPSYLILNVERRRIRHRTTLNFNDLIFNRFWFDLEIHHLILRIVVCRNRLFSSLISKMKCSELPLKWVCIPEGRRLYIASCRIWTKWPSGRRTPLYRIWFTSLTPMVQLWSPSLCSWIVLKFSWKIPARSFLSSNVYSLRYSDSKFRKLSSASKSWPNPSVLASACEA